MPTDLPVDLFVLEIIRHTPLWTWGLLAFLTLVGLRQMADHEVTARRLITVSAIWAALSFGAAVSAFGAQVGVVLAWVLGMALVVGVNQRLGLPRHVELRGVGRFGLRGSLWPLATLWGVFAVRYVTAVLLALHPTLTHDTLFALLIPALYGALSGVFAARTLRVLRGAAATARLQIA